MKALSINKLMVHFGSLQALNRVSLSVDIGEKYGIIGPNGSGKTTLFNSICGYLKPSAGSICLFGKDLKGIPAQRRVAMGLGRTFQEINLFKELTVMDNIMLALVDKSIGFRALKLREAKVEREGRKLAESFGLAQHLNDLVKHLSYGDQRLLEILLALALKPKLLLLDEPMAGLAAAERIIISRTIKELPAELTIVIIEHDLDVIFNISEKMTVLNYGAVVATGSNESIMQNKEVQETYFSRSARGSNA